MFLVTHKFYTELSILLAGFNDIYEKWMSMAETLVAVTVTMNMTIAVVYLHPRGIITAVVAFPLLLYFIKSSGVVFEESWEGLQCWRRVEHKSKWFVRYLRSCRPLRIRFGSFFYADWGLLLTVVSTILTETANLVVTLG